MDNRTGTYKFLILSVIGLFCFFIPFGGHNCTVVYICSVLKMMLQPYGLIIVLLFTGFGVVRVLKNKNKKVKDIFLCMISLIIILSSFVFGSYLSEAIELAYSICITVFVSGTFSLLITESGLVEFVAVFCESIMRRLLNVPGNAVMDIITSFFASSSVGVLITSQYYKEKKYTQREACFIASNFSVVSFGFMFGIISIAKLDRISSQVVISVIVLNFVLGMILRNIYPIKGIPDILCDGKIRHSIIENSPNNKIRKGMESGVVRAQAFTKATMLLTIKQVSIFCQEIIIQVIPIYFFALVVMNFTNVFEVIGKPFEIILETMQIPCAEMIAPTMFIGIFEVSLPAVFISNMVLPISVKYFVTVLSLVQVIFFTETANAILQSSIPLKLLDLIKIFILRTLFAIPILAIVVNLFF